MTDDEKLALMAARARVIQETGRLLKAVTKNLGELEPREVTLANGPRINRPYCGSVEVRFKKKACGGA